MSQQEIIDALKVLKIATSKEIAEFKNMNIHTTRENITRLIKKGKIRKTEYQLVEQPRYDVYILVD